MRLNPGEMKMQVRAIRALGTLQTSKNKRVRKKAKRTAQRRRRNPGLKGKGWWISGGIGALAVLGGLWRPARGVLRGFGVGGVDHAEGWAVDRAAAALDEASREGSSSVAPTYAEWSRMMSGGEFFSADSDGFSILIQALAMIGEDQVPIANARLRLYMAERGISWKSGGSTATATEVAELKSRLGARRFLPAWRPSYAAIGVGFALLTASTVALLIKRRKK